MGINAGEVVGGVISSKRLSYDYWGDAINVAARLQGLAPEDGITVSEGVYRTVRARYRFHPARRALLKNLGKANVYAVDLAAAETAWRPGPATDDRELGVPRLTCRIGSSVFALRGAQEA